MVAVRMVRQRLKVRTSKAAPRPPRVKTLNSGAAKTLFTPPTGPTRRAAASIPNLDVVLITLCQLRLVHIFSGFFIFKHTLTSKLVKLKEP